MKLVINTQYRENYGSEDQPYWKFKGGAVYAVEDLTPAQAERVMRDGIPTLKAMIEYNNPMSEEYIIDFSVVADDTAICDEWETLIKLSWVNNRWTASEVTYNDGYGSSMHQGIERKIATYDLLMGGERENYTCTYVMYNGDVVKSSDIEEYFKEAA